jgi:hypothetical protein
MSCWIMASRPCGLESSKRPPPAYRADTYRRGAGKGSSTQVLHRHYQIKVGFRYPVTIIDLEEKRKKIPPSLNEALYGALESLRNEHFLTEEAFSAQANHEFFPCHLLYLAALSRSLELLDGFLLLYKNKQYGNCIALLRMQMDSIMRFYGILITKDMHDTADKVANGVRLDTIKDRDGKLLKDFYIRKCLTKLNPDFDFDSDYKYACGFVHFSDEHFLQLLDRSWDEDASKTRWRLGSDYGHLDASDERAILLAFFRCTNGVLKLADILNEESQNYNVAELKIRYRRVE